MIFDIDMVTRAAICWSLTKWWRCRSWSSIFDREQSDKLNTTACAFLMIHEANSFQRYACFYQISFRLSRLSRFKPLSLRRGYKENEIGPSFLILIASFAEWLWSKYCQRDTWYSIYSLSRTPYMSRRIEEIEPITIASRVLIQHFADSDGRRFWCQIFGGIKRRNEMICAGQCWKSSRLWFATMPSGYFIFIDDGVCLCRLVISPRIYRP